MKSDFLIAITQLSAEKNLSQEVILEAKTQHVFGGGAAQDAREARDRAVGTGCSRIRVGAGQHQHIAKRRGGDDAGKAPSQHEHIALIE